MKNLFKQIKILSVKKFIKTTAPVEGEKIKKYYIK